MDQVTGQALATWRRLAERDASAPVKDVAARAGVAW
jgi:hypothetical protein